MQGRLVGPSEGRIQSFPRDHWAEEFGLAAQAGLDCIEWIDDLYGANVNPICTDAGIGAIRSLEDKSGVGVFSVCADWFMDFPLVRASPKEREDRVGMLQWLLKQSQQLGVGRIVVPFVDASRMETEEDVDQVVSILGQVIPSAERAGVEIHLETSLPPRAFAAVLSRLPSQWIKANYDSGNSSSLGYDPAEEFAAYGARVGSIHIKDRVLGGGTVPLGLGDTKFGVLFKAVSDTGYRGDFILQVARGETGDEVAWARRNRRFVADGLSLGAGATT